MKRLPRDEAREKRIDAEILVDAYDEEERAMGWYYYLDETLNFPFQAKCIHQHHKSPLKEEHVVEVAGMAPEHKCMREMFVQVIQDGNANEIAVLVIVQLPRRLVWRSRRPGQAKWQVTLVIAGLNYIVRLIAVDRLTTALQGSVAVGIVSILRHDTVAIVRL